MGTEGALDQGFVDAVWIGRGLHFVGAIMEFKTCKACGWRRHGGGVRRRRCGGFSLRRSRGNSGFRRFGGFGGLNLWLGRFGLWRLRLLFLWNHGDGDLFELLAQDSFPSGKEENRQGERAVDNRRDDQVNHGTLAL